MGVVLALAVAWLRLRDGLTAVRTTWRAGRRVSERIALQSVQPAVDVPGGRSVSPPTKSYLAIPPSTS